MSLRPAALPPYHVARARAFRVGEVSPCLPHRKAAEMLGFWAFGVGDTVSTSSTAAREDYFRQDTVSSVSRAPQPSEENRVQA